MTSSLPGDRIRRGVVGRRAAIRVSGAGGRPHRLRGRSAHSVLARAPRRDALSDLSWDAGPQPPRRVRRRARALGAPRSRGRARARRARGRRRSRHPRERGGSRPVRCPAGADGGWPVPARGAAQRIAAPRLDRVTIAPDVLALVGHTPLVRLGRIAAGLRPTIVAKLEHLNPGGSVKDRIGALMIEDAERRGLLRKGGTIVEPTSGNTGVGLALAAAINGYRLICTMADKQSQEKRDLLRAYGAEVVVCPSAVPPESPESYYKVADRLTRDIPGAFQPNQYYNAMNPEAHYRTTGPEIWEQTEGRITHRVGRAGTGGPVTGAGRDLTGPHAGLGRGEGEPPGALYTGDIHPYKTEGIGEDFYPGTFDAAIVDRWVRVSDRDSFLTARRLTREEGILVGGSSGTAMFAALEVAKELDRDAMVVVLFADSGRSYLSKIYNDEWMRQNGYLQRY